MATVEASPGFLGTPLGHESLEQQQPSHAQCKSAFDQTLTSMPHNRNPSSTTQGGDGDAPCYTSLDIHPWRLQFTHSEDVERWFCTRFYARNRFSAFSGIVFISLAFVLFSGITALDPKFSFPLYRTLLYFGVVLFGTAIASAMANLFLQSKVLDETPVRRLQLVTTRSNNGRDGRMREIIRRDGATHMLFTWWEVSLCIQHLGALVGCLMVTVGKRIGCVGGSTSDPLPIQRCTGTIQFDSTILLFVIVHCFVYPVRWMLHVGFTAGVMIVLFGVRFIPGVSTVDTRYIITYAMVMCLPLVLFLVVRYRRERGSRLLFVAELQLEAALEQLSVLSLRLESLLVPWVPLAAEEQIQLLRSTSYDHVWGISERTVVGVVQLVGFGAWVAEAGASAAARALHDRVQTVDRYYELLSPLSLSLLKCHVDGDSYTLVSPSADDAGLMMLVVLCACHERSMTGSGELLVSPEYPPLNAAIACGLGGVIGVPASGTLVPIGPVTNAVHDLLAMQQRRNVDDAVPLLVEPCVTQVLALVGNRHVEYRGPQDFSVHKPRLLDVHPSALLSSSLFIEASHRLMNLCDTLQSPDTRFRFYEVSPERNRSYEDRDFVSAAAVVPRTACSQLHTRSANAASLPISSTHDLSSSNTPAESVATGGNNKRSDLEPVPYQSGDATTHGVSGSSRAVNLATNQHCSMVPFLTFSDPTTEQRFRDQVRQHISGVELLACSIGSAVMGIFMIIILAMYGQTTLKTVSPMSFAVAATTVGAALIAAAQAHRCLPACTHELILASHECLFVVFYALVVAAVYAAAPQSSGVGDAQLVWLYMLLALNFARPRAHGVLPHVMLDIVGSAVFVVQALLYPHQNSLMRYLNVACDAVVAVGPLFINAWLDAEARQQFAVEASLSDLHASLLALNDDINRLLKTTRASNPAVIFAARAQSRQRLRARQRLPLSAPETALCQDNVDPSTSTTIASRAMDTGVLLIEFAPAAGVLEAGGATTPGELRAAVTQVKRFIAAVDALLGDGFQRMLRVVKATPTMLLVVPDRCVVGQLSRSRSDMPLVQLALDVVRRLLPEHRMVGRAVVDSGMLVSVLLGVSSISLELTGPAVERARALVAAAPWGGCFVTRRLLRYEGISVDRGLRLATPSGLVGVVSGVWESWRVRGHPMVAIAAVTCAPPPVMGSFVAP